VDVTAILAEAEALSVDERLHLVEALWESIADDVESLPLTDAQRQEVERRIADDLANPDDVVSWDEVEAQALARARK
jgi:putative addiction module component (TIGR02574 family)